MESVFRNYSKNEGVRRRAANPNQALVPCSAALVAKKNQVSAAANAEFREQVGNVKFHGALGNVKPIRDFLVRKVFEQARQDFLLAPA